MDEIKKNLIELPMIPLRGLTVFPNMVLHFDIGREKSIKALEEAMMMDQKIFLSSQMEVEVDLPTGSDFYKVGTVSKIKQMLKLPGDAIRVLVEGVDRGKIIEIIEETPFFRVEIEEYIDEDKIEVTKECEALMRTV